MGACMSSSGGATSAPVPAAKATALVLLPTGELREYPRPATAARVLEDLNTDGEGHWFLCDSDRMGFEGPVPAVRGAEALRAGRIYFVLPADARRRGLRREDVAALAVRASAALASKASAAASSSSGTGGKRRSGAAVAPLVFLAPAEDDEDEEEETVGVNAVAARKALAGTVKRQPAARRPRRQPRRFASDLTAIPECELSE